MDAEGAKQAGCVEWSPVRGSLELTLVAKLPREKEHFLNSHYWGQQSSEMNIDSRFGTLGAMGRSRVVAEQVVMTAMLQLPPADKAAVRSSNLELPLARIWRSSRCRSW